MKWAKRGKKFDMRKQNVVEVDEQGAAAGCQPHPVAEKTGRLPLPQDQPSERLAVADSPPEDRTPQATDFTPWTRTRQLRIPAGWVRSSFAEGNWLAKPVTAEPTSSPVSSPCCCVIAAIRACVSSVFAA